MSLDVPGSPGGVNVYSVAAVVSVAGAGWSASLLRFGPNEGIFIFTLGLSFLLLELNRPGAVLPGAFGLLLSLLAMNSWRQWELRPWCLAVLAIGLLLPFMQTRWGATVLVAVTSPAALSVGFRWLIAGPAPAHVDWSAALGCGVSLGLGASALANVAYRARRNKALSHRDT